MPASNEQLFLALQALGDVLASRGQRYSCIVAGGASLAALGVLQRVTSDVDVMAVRDESGVIRVAPPALPDFVVEAARDIGRELNLTADWLNTQMAAGLKAGLPPNFIEKLDWRQFGTLSVGFAGRETLIALKLEAASDDPPHGRTDVHVADLIALDATTAELTEAAAWVLEVNVDPRRTDTIAWVRDYVAEHRSR